MKTNHKGAARMKNIARILFIILAVIFFLGFVFSLLWLLAGSLETFPTAEQQEKAHIGAALGMIVSLVPCLVCTLFCVKTRRKK